MVSLWVDGQEVLQWDQRYGMVSLWVDSTGYAILKWGQRYGIFSLWVDTRYFDGAIDTGWSAYGWTEKQYFNWGSEIRGGQSLGGHAKRQ